jgi:perosamine synthetase
VVSNVRGSGSLSVAAVSRKVTARADDPVRFRVLKDPVLSWDFLRITSGDLEFNGAVGRRGFRYLPFWARSGIYHALGALRIPQGATVLAPAYICRSAVEPIEAHGSKVEFYDVGLDCRPNFVDLESKITTRTRAILAVHYFGFPQDVAHIKEICDRNELALIEDCAHVLTGSIGGKPLGSFGDVSIFSWRKFLPVYDGGELVFNRDSAYEIKFHKETWLFTLKEAKSLMEMKSSQSGHPFISALSGSASVAKKIWDRLCASAGDSRADTGVNTSTLEFDERAVFMQMSRISEWVLAHSNIGAVIHKRRKNYLYLKNKLSCVSGVASLYPDLPEGICPWIYPLFFDGIQDAHLVLRQLGIPAVTWGGVRPSKVNTGVFPTADFLYDNLIFLPLHQNLQQKDLDIIVGTVKQVLNKYPSRPSRFYG